VRKAQSHWLPNICAGTAPSSSQRLAASGDVSPRTIGTLNKKLCNMQISRICNKIGRIPLTPPPGRNVVNLPSGRFPLTRPMSAMIGGNLMPDGATGGLRPSPDFRELIEATVAAIREQKEEQLADRDAQIAGLVAERQELHRLVIDAQTAERIARDELGGLCISERGAAAEVAALHHQLEVTERQAVALRTELSELRKTEQTALDWAKTSAAEASELRKKADDATTAERIAREEAAGLRTRLDSRRAGCGRGCGTSGEGRAVNATRRRLGSTIRGLLIAFFLLLVVVAVFAAGIGIYANGSGSRCCSPGGRGCSPAQPSPWRSGRGGSGGGCRSVRSTAAARDPRPEGAGRR
jgi:hypothetical protein